MPYSHFPLIPQKLFEQTEATEARFGRRLQKGVGLTEEAGPFSLVLDQRLPDERETGLEYG